MESVSDLAGDFVGHSGDSSKHEAVGDEWLKTGHCPIAKSYNAASKVMPLVAKALQPPHGGNTLSSSRLLGLWRFMLPSFHSYAQEICAGAENCHALTIGASILGQVIGKSCSCCWRSFSISEALKEEVLATRAFLDDNPWQS
ncbi:hypothetical protein Bca52824_065461 [Brassica carinata]|uniref:Uncharacterized protein n=1 Tax=Brassica carinata TaxID=52824 RepID=A0A8X7UCF9_BRACI|nr:hypothetical protein Bca52824_065461 [Brassica carinata]